MAIEVKAKYDYNSGHEDDLSFSAGQVIIIIEEVDEEWYNGEYVDGHGKRHQGMFPRNFVVAIPSHSNIVPSPPTVKQGTAKETPIKPRVSKTIGSPKAAAKQSTPLVGSYSKFATSPPPLASNLKADSRTPVREIQTSHQPVCCPLLSLIV